MGQGSDKVKLADLVVWGAVLQAIQCCTALWSGHAVQNLAPAVGYHAADGFQVLGPQSSNSLDLLITFSSA